MVYTLTLNPALDYIMKVDNYKHGYVNRTKKEMLIPGGKGINVSIVLTNLGVENVALGFVGGGIGNEFEKLLKKDNIKCNFVYIKNGSTRINVKIKEEYETEINASGPYIDEEELQELYKKFANLKKDDYLVLSGSIPPSLPKDLYSRIASEYGKTANIIVDAEGDALLSTLPYNPFLIKPNHYELSAIVNKNLESTAKIVDAAFRLQDLGARNIFVSLAEKGGIFVSESKDVYCSPAPCGMLVNSTGSGDSALAGFLSEYLISKNYKKAFTTGICAGSACAFSEHLATKEKIQELAERMVEN